MKRKTVALLLIPVIILLLAGSLLAMWLLVANGQKTVGGWVAGALFTTALLTLNYANKLWASLAGDAATLAELRGEETIPEGHLRCEWCELVLPTELGKMKKLAQVKYGGIGERQGFVCLSCLKKGQRNIVLMLLGVGILIGGYFLFLYLKFG